MVVDIQHIEIKTVERLNNISEKYFPEGSYPLVLAMLKPHDVSIRLKRKRSTKYGDFTSNSKRAKIPVITVNNDLNPYSFLITLLHELAHFLVWKEGHHYAKPHGRTWKNHFTELMQTMMNENVFPESLLPFIIRHIENPSATSCSDTKLFRELSKFDTNQMGVFVDDIKDGELFQTKDGQIFSRDKKIRKRILCTRLKKRKQYLFSPIYRVLPMIEKIESGCVNITGQLSLSI